MYQTECESELYYSVSEFWLTKKRFPPEPFLLQTSILSVEYAGPSKVTYGKKINYLVQAILLDKIVQITNLFCKITPSCRAQHK